MSESLKQVAQQGLEALELAMDNLREHGDNCFLHDEGEYNSCFCGKDSLMSHLQSTVEGLAIALSQPAPSPQPAVQVVDAFAEGWRMAADWANRDDLLPDMDSPQYAKERDERLAELRPAVESMTDSDTVQVYGVKNGQQTLIGTAPIPPRMKARELARAQFGHFEDDDGSDADLCFCALEQLIEHMERTAHHGITAKAEDAHQPTKEAE